MRRCYPITTAHGLKLTYIILNRTAMNRLLQSCLVNLPNERHLVDTARHGIYRSARRVRSGGPWDRHQHCQPPHVSPAASLPRVGKLKKRVLKLKRGGSVNDGRRHWADRRMAHCSYRWPRSRYPCPLRISFASLAPNRVRLTRIRSARCNSLSD
jgi:hypothetical protein